MNIYKTKVEPGQHKHYRQTLNIVYRTHVGSIDLNVVIKNQINDRRKKYYNCDKIKHFAKNCR